MANELNELDPIVMEDGRQTAVIAKPIPVKVGVGSTIFEVVLWVLGIIPGLIFLLVKIKAGTYLRQLEQRIQHDASQIDNYLQQRVVILTNAAKLLDKSIDTDKEVFSSIARLRSGVSDENRAEAQEMLDRAEGRINVAVERYPELKSQNQIAEVLRENAYLQKEITAAREVYNDSVRQWNAAIQEWPAKMIVAAKCGYTTRVPFAASKAVKEQAESILF